MAKDVIFSLQSSLTGHEDNPSPQIVEIEESEESSQVNMPTLLEEPRPALLPDEHRPSDRDKPEVSDGVESKTENQSIFPKGNAMERDKCCICACVIVSHHQQKATKGKRIFNPKYI